MTRIIVLFAPVSKRGAALGACFRSEFLSEVSLYIFVKVMALRREVGVLVVSSLLKSYATVMLLAQNFQANFLPFLPSDST